MLVLCVSTVIWYYQYDSINKVDGDFETTMFNDHTFFLKIILEHMESIAKELINAEDLSGLLLVFPMHCVHILEVSTGLVFNALAQGETAL